MGQEMLRMKLGIVTILAAIALPAATYVGGHAWLAFLASRDPVPDQGAMVLAFLTFCASVALAVALGCVGLILLLWRSSPPGQR
jgi:hypothetical protein